MSASGRSRGKKGPHKSIKLPFGAPNVPEISSKCLKQNESIDETVKGFCDELMNTPWMAYNVRPPRDLFGIYVISKWYSIDDQWALLYLGRGPIRNYLEGHFSGKQRSPIASYLSSFPKESRNLIWIKWLKDPFYPYESINMEALIKAIKVYNNGEKPAFNVVENIEDEKLPEDFSIVPDWHKPSQK